MKTHFNTTECKKHCTMLCSKCENGVIAVPKHKLNQVKNLLNTINPDEIDKQDLDELLSKMKHPTLTRIILTGGEL
jgi:hypothetical protein